MVAVLPELHSCLSAPHPGQETKQTFASSLAEPHSVARNGVDVSLV